MDAGIFSNDHKSLKIGDLAPNFRARTTQGERSLEDYRGRWLVFFSHPADFTPVCTSEFVALARAQEEFDRLDCALLGLSVDSPTQHPSSLHPRPLPMAARPHRRGPRRLPCGRGSPGAMIGR